MDVHQAEDGDGPARVVGIGASAGGVDALIRVVRKLPASFPAAICIVLHVPSSGRTLLAAVLGRQTALQVIDAADDQELMPGASTWPRTIATSRAARDGGREPISVQ